MINICNVKEKKAYPNGYSKDSKDDSRILGKVIKHNCLKIHIDSEQKKNATTSSPKKGKLKWPEAVLSIRLTKNKKLINVQC